MDRIECPNCKTSYTVERLGLDWMMADTRPFVATVACMVCKVTFDAYRTTEMIPGARTWRTLWQRKDTTQVTLRTEARSQ